MSNSIDAPAHAFCLSVTIMCATFLLCWEINKLTTAIQIAAVQCAIKEPHDTRN